MALEHVAKRRTTNPSAIDTHEITSLETLVLVVSGLDRRTCGPFALLLAQTDEPPLVTDQV